MSNRKQKSGSQKRKDREARQAAERARGARPAGDQVEAWEKMVGGSGAVEPVERDPLRDPLQVVEDQEPDHVFLMERGSVVWIRDVLSGGRLSLPHCVP